MQGINFIESKLLGFSINDSGTTASFSIRIEQEKTISLKIHGIEKLLISDVRQQNIIESIFLWPDQKNNEGLEESAFLLFAEASKENCHDAMKPIVQSKIDRIIKGDLLLMEATAIYGAQFLVAFLSMEVMDIVIN